MYDANLSLNYIEPGANPATDRLGAADRVRLAELVLRKSGGAPFRVLANGPSVAAPPEFWALLRLPAIEGPRPLVETLAGLDSGDSAAIMGVAVRALAERGGFSGVRRLRWPDGTVRLIEWDAIAGEDADGGACLVGVARDGTADIEARNLRAGQKELIENLVDGLPLPVAILDTKLRYVAVNRRWIADFGIAAADGLVGKRHYDIFPDTPIHWRELHHIALNGERITRDFDDYERANGTRMTINWVLQPWRDKTGAIGGIVIMAEILRVALAQKADADMSDLSQILFEIGALRPGGEAAAKGKPPPPQSGKLHLVRLER